MVEEPRLAQEPHAVPTYRHILVAVDLTESSVRVAECGRLIAAALGADLELIHVVEPVPVVMPIPPEPLVPDLVDTQEEMIDAAQDRLAELAAKLNLPQALWSVEVGKIKAEILRVAREHRVDLIVIGNREKHGLAIIFGPTEDAVLHGAPCDVLAVRAVT
jgi:universal stress protein A